MIWRSKKLAFCLMAAAFVLACRLLYQDGAFMREIGWDGVVRLEAPAMATPDDAGNLYVVDQAMMRVLKVDSAGRVVWRLVGGDKVSAAFYRCRSLASGPDGVYLINQVYDATGRMVERESILHFSADGRFVREVFHRAYGVAASKPELYGWLKEVQATDGGMYGIYLAEDALELYRLDAKGEAPAGRFPLADARRQVLSCMVSDDGRSVAYVDKEGRILRWETNGWEAVYRGYGDNRSGGTASIPCAVAPGEGRAILFADSAAERVRRLEESGALADALDAPRAYMPTLEDPVAYEALHTAAGGNFAAVNTQAVFYEADGALRAAAAFPCAGALYAYWLLLWLCGAFVGMAALYAAARAGIYVFHRSYSRSVGYVAAVICTAAAVSLVTGGILAVQQQKELSRQLSGQVYSLVELAKIAIPGDALQRFQSYADGGSEADRRLRAGILRLRAAVQENPEAWFFVLYKTDGHKIYQVMDSADTVTPLTRKYGAYEGSPYSEVAAEGRQRMVENITTSIGVWTFSIGPIYDSGGALAGFVEIGVNSQILAEQWNGRILDISLLVLTGTIVAVLVLTELIYFLEALRRRRDVSASPLAVVRPLAFVFVMPLYLQSAFLPIYISKLYAPVFGLPESVGIAIPISAGALAMGIFSYYGGVWQKRWGIRRLLIGGGAVAGGGFLLCAWTQAFWVFTLGKLVAGGGMGVVLVALNTLIATQEDEAEVQEGFSSYYAAYFAAINVGCVCGGLTASWLGYREAVALSALLSLLGAALSLHLLDGKAAAAQARDQTAGKMSASSFLRDRGAASFLFLLYAPYLVAGYFMYYFFPIFASENGFDEARIAQVFLLNGLSVVYLGPFLTRVFTKLLGNAGAALFGSALCAASLGLFIWRPELSYAVIVIIAMGLADSFVYTAQASYYTALPAARRFGVDRASGVKNIVENIADTAAPVIFGTALLAGVQAGIALIASAFASAAVLFCAAMRRRLHL